MLSINPAIPNNILVLDRCESFEAYRQVYGDRLIQHYEANGAIYLPYIPIQFDLEFFAESRWPDSFKKVGTTTGLDRPVFRRDGDRVVLQEKHPLNLLFGDRPEMAAYVQSQIAMANAQLTAGLRTLFPKYALDDQPSISWRLTPADDEQPHFDSFRSGAPIPLELQRTHRLKAFVNIDSMPRIWRIFMDLPRTLAALASLLPQRLPTNINVLNGVINRTRLIDAIPGHEIHFPQMSAIIANGETLAHQVVFGRRMIAFEALCDARCMLDPSRHSYTSIRRWLLDAGLTPDDDPHPQVAKYISGAVATY